MANDLLTRSPHEELSLAGISHLPTTAASVQPLAEKALAFRFSIESFWGVMITALLLLGLASGAYKKIERNEAADAYRQGERSAAKHDLNGALKDYTTAIQRDHRYYDAYYRRAEIYAELGDERAAENDIRQAISIHPLWPFALDLRRQFDEYKRKSLQTPISDSFDLKPVIH
jgi:tetratricopeptide (TPR) repeat protein